MRYELSRGSNDKTRHVVCREDEFYTIVPDHIRKRGPWQVINRGEVQSLKPAYRQALTRQGWLYLETHPVGFSVTA